MYRIMGYEQHKPPFNDQGICIIAFQLSENKLSNINLSSIPSIQISAANHSFQDVEIKIVKKLQVWSVSWLSEDSWRKGMGGEEEDKKEEEGGGGSRVSLKETPLKQTLQFHIIMCIQLIRGIFIRDVEVHQRCRGTLEIQEYIRDVGVHQRCRGTLEMQEYIRDVGVHQRCRSTLEMQEYIRDVGIYQRCRSKLKMQEYIRDVGVHQR